MKIKKILQNIFSIRNTDRHKLITIFGIKFRFKSKFNELKFELNELKFELNETVNFFYGQLRNDLYSVMRFSGGDAFKKERMKIGEKEHQRNVEKLLENLDANARYNCEKCLEKQNKIFYQDAILLNDIYSSDELAQIEKIHHFKRSVTKENGYYQCLSYKLPINFFETSVFFHKLGLDHIKNKNYVKNKTLIDVGAYIADSCLLLRTEFPHENIIGFEPIKNNYNLAFETIKLNQLKNIKMENYALGDNCGFVNMQFAGTEGEASQTVPLETLSNDNVVEMLTLDEYVKQNNIEKVGLIKVDIEGAEQSFLSGAKNTIIEHRPVLLISIYHNYNDFYKIKPLIESWNLGYQFDFHSPVLEYAVNRETLLICEPK